MQASRLMFSRPRSVGVVAAMLVIVAFFTPAIAQSADAYRAEIVIVERKIDPANVVEQMAYRAPVPVHNLPQQLWLEDERGNRLSSLKLVPRAQMHLNSAASRLENSGRFRVLMTASWYQSFPPDYTGQAMQIGLGDWLASAGHRAVEGQITIDRKRYLHVNVKLNHWQPAPSQPSPQSAANLPDQSGEPSDNSESSRSIAAMAQGGDLEADTATEALAGENQPQLLSWIREVRRMRSEEIHFLDSPTIGVLVFFKKIGN